MVNPDRQELVLAALAAPDETETGRSLSAIREAIGMAPDRMSACVELITALERLQGRELVEDVDQRDDDVPEEVRFRPTETGGGRGTRIRRELLEATIDVAGGPDGRQVEAVAERVGRPPLAVAAASAPDGVYHPEDAPERSFVGRESLLESGRDHLDAVSEGDGGILALSGPPGVGKTTLADRLLDDAREAGLSVLRTRASREGGLAYQSLRDLVADLDGDPFADAGPSVDDPDARLAQRTVLFETLTDMLAPTPDAEVGTPPARVVYVDDIHLAGPGTLAYLEYLIDHLDAHRLLVICSYRPAELPDDAPFDPGTTEGTSVALLPVEPLDRAQTRTLLEGTVGTVELPEKFVSAVHERTGGNPLFVESTVETLLETGQIDPELGVFPRSPDDVDVPAAVRETIDHRIRQFPASARNLLQWMGLLGEQFDPGVVSAVADESDVRLRTYLDSFVDAAILDRHDDGQVTFRSEVFREAILEALSEDERRRRHGAIAAELEVRDEADPAAVATHHERAGNRDPAVAAYRAAASEARAVYAHETAVEHLQAALGLARDADDPTELVAVATEIASVHETLGAYDDAERFAEFARERAESDRQRRRALAQSSAVAIARGSHDRGLELAEAGLNRGNEDGDVVTCRLLGQKCRALEGLGEYDAAREATRQRRTVAAAIGDDAQLAAALDALAQVADSQGEYETAKDHLEESLAVHRETGDRRGVAANHRTRGKVLFRQGNHERAREQFETSLSIHREVGDRHGVAKVHNDLGATANALGELDRAREHFEESLEIKRSVGARDDAARSLASLANVAMARENYDRARELFEESNEIFRATGARHYVGKVLHNLGVIARAEGEYDRARELLEESREVFATVGARHGVADSLHHLGRVASERGEYGRARNLFEESLAIKREIGARRGAASSLDRLGLLAWEEGNHERAREYLPEAAEAYHETGAPDDAARCLAHRATLAFEDGDPDAGLAAGDRALERFEDATTPVPDDLAAALVNLFEAASDTGFTDRTQEWRRQALSALDETLGDTDDERQRFECRIRQLSPGKGDE